LVGHLIIRGIIVGIVAGILAFAWARTFGEPALNIAMGFESAQNEAKAKAALASGQHAEEEEPEIFSRGVQSGIGLFTGVVAVGAGIGGLFAVLFAFANGRFGSLGPEPTSALLALIGLVSIYVIPALKYPADPPSVGNLETIKLRTGLYFLMMAISVASTIGALALRGGLARKYGSWDGSVLAAAAYIVVIASAFLILPGFNEVPANFPAVTLWNFRIASLGIQTVLWASIGVMFGYFNGRIATNSGRRTAM
jgi:hypothetical protein